MPVYLKMADNPHTWGIIELQGDLESRNGGALQSQFVGDLHYGMQSNGVPTLIVGHHILYGKAVPLEKPFAVMEKKKTDINTEYIIKALVDRKLVFKIRPKPIIAAVPGC
ncbi:chromosome transmission fidelity protein 8 homolog [Halyomorpha halys]|uniref:chromosome transmission fidelity protein 8 homolog n=1 Tax=Halyomorpha halys TaxID=286706 RepID=UPI0006D519E7|nr:chromosome transmission fidelity protein 8 homolog [Halyomorpha halys]